MSSSTVSGANKPVGRPPEQLSIQRSPRESDREESVSLFYLTRLVASYACAEGLLCCLNIMESWSKLTSKQGVTKKADAVGTATLLNKTE